MKSLSFTIRQASKPDESFLREMLYHSLHVPENSSPLPRDVVTQPEIAKYVEGWGRNGDLGFIAVDSGKDEPMGAAWLRLFTESEQGYGYVDDETPELGLAVLPEHRGRGVGSALLKRLLEAAGGLYDSISLSVSADNRAVSLYERMGFKRYRTSGDSLTMLYQLRK